MPRPPGPLLLGVVMAVGMVRLGWVSQGEPCQECRWQGVQGCKQAENLQTMPWWALLSRLLFMVQVTAVVWRAQTSTLPASPIFVYPVPQSRTTAGCWVSYAATTMAAWCS